MLFSITCTLGFSVERWWSRDMGVPLGVPLGEGAPLTVGDSLQGVAVWWEVSSPGLLRQTRGGKMVKAQLE